MTSYDLGLLFLASSIPAFIVTGITLVFVRKSSSTKFIKSIFLITIWIISFGAVFLFFTSGFNIPA